MLNFTGKLRSSSQAKFPSFSVVGLVIKLQMNLNKEKTLLNQARLILYCLLLKCKSFEVKRGSTSQTDGANSILFTVVM